METKHAFAPAVLLLVMLARQPAQGAEPAQARAGVVYVVDGIGGLNVFNTFAKWSLSNSGVPHDFRDFQWSHGTGRFLRDLQDHRDFHKRAAELATLVREQLEKEPDRPVYLLGHSAGTGMVLLAAEMLPPASVERIVLLSAAVSPHYDLRPALKATRGEIVSFNSTCDRVILGWGTSTFGTVDRYYEPAAGMQGFLTPPDLSEADQQLYGRLVQVPWRPHKLLEFQGGGHVSTSMPLFLAKEVTPWLTK
jgi:pimeloyl-ACP methyl ester carboxylesterase